METTAQPSQENQKEETPSESEEATISETEKLALQVKKLQEELDSEKRDSEELARRIKYLQADVINVQRQSDKVLAETRNASRTEFMLELISIKEDIERAISASSGLHETDPIIDGLSMVLSRMENTLKSEGVELVRVELGSKLDPRLQEAVAYVERDDREDGTIISLIRNGYTSRGKVIRPALVEVSRPNHHKLEREPNKEINSRTAPSYLGNGSVLRVGNKKLE